MEAGLIEKQGAEALETISLRPRYHFTPARHWINDPNGLVYWNGEYHLFFQYNPLESVQGNLSWGHATSPDLLHWQELPVAIPYQDGVMAFSGSALVDWQNLSGFGLNAQPPLVALYTGHHVRQGPEQSGLEDQRLAYSTDDGRTWREVRGKSGTGHRGNRFP